MKSFLSIFAFIALAGIFGPLFGSTPEDGTKDISSASLSFDSPTPEKQKVSCKEFSRPYSHGIASWYGPGFQGRRMANGKPFDSERYTVAHKTLRLGTRVCITSRENGASVIATVTDRGPFIGSRIIDLSRRVAEELGMTERGIGAVDIAIPFNDGVHSI